MHCGRFAVRNRDAMFHPGAHAIFTLKDTEDSFLFVQHLAAACRKVYKLTDNLFFIFAFKVQRHQFGFQ